MVKVEDNNGILNINAPTYLCKLAKFERNTDKTDGSILMVADDASNSITAYCIALDGKWYDL